MTTCPKHMVYGPCGGVTAAGGCELDDRVCPFVDAAVLDPLGDERHRPRPIDIGRAVIDLRLPADRAQLVEIAGLFRSVGATALIGEHVDDADGLSPAERAERLADVDLSSIVTVTGRRRTVDAHRTEIERLAGAGVCAVHCVTGDHPAVRFSPDATATFTLDGTRLATAARSMGAHVSVGECPAAPPIDERPARLAMKQAVGADLAILNHAGAPGAMIDFADRCRAAGADLALVAPVPVITDVASAHALAQFPGLVLPDGLIERILSAPEPRRAGIDAAVEIGLELLHSGRFVAVNLSGSAAAVGPVARAEMMTDIARRLAPA